LGKAETKNEQNVMGARIVVSPKWQPQKAFLGTDGERSCSGTKNK